VASPIVAVGVAPRVSAKVKRLSGRRFRFSGRVRPAHDGTQMIIQRLRGGQWVNVKSTVARHSGSGSRYRKRVRLRRGGTFRVLANINDGDHIPSASRNLRVRVRR
jgi:hypothetical protein